MARVFVSVPHHTPLANLLHLPSSPRDPLSTLDFCSLPIQQSTTDSTKTHLHIVYPNMFPCASSFKAVPQLFIVSGSLCRFYVRPLIYLDLSLWEVLKMDSVDIYLTFHPNTKEYTFCSAPHGPFFKTDHMPGNTANNYQWNWNSYWKTSQPKSQDQMVLGQNSIRLSKRTDMQTI